MINLKKIYDRRTQVGRKDLGGEAPLNDEIQLVLLIVFLAVWCIDSFWIRQTIFLSAFVPLFIRICLGIFLLFWSVYLTWYGLAIIFGEERATPNVVRKGPFSYVRHPIYLASILFYLGITALTFSLASLALSIVAMIYYNFAAIYEEKLLITKYGEEYKKYRAEVGRWLPKLFK
jgi:protein-S-isoprenylcysteine O-methyltransferase Ste14